MEAHNISSRQSSSFHRPGEIKGVIYLGVSIHGNVTGSWINRTIH